MSFNPDLNKKSLYFQETDKIVSLTNLFQQYNIYS